MKRNANGIVKVQAHRDLFGRELESKGDWESRDNGNLLLFTSHGCESRRKVIAFDLDGTLIVTKSGNVFPTDMNDWKLIGHEVSKKLSALYEDGYKLVIFTNQKGIQVGKVDKNQFRLKIERIVSKIDLPMQVFISTGSSKYRKPCTGMWNTLIELNGDVDLEKSLYVGDAAGRHKTKVRPKKDHSSADRFFAANVGLRFETPEEFFFGQKTNEPWGPPEFEARKYLDSERDLFSPKDTNFSTNDLEVIVMVGFPGSGKSTFARKIAQEHGYVIVNRDTLGTWQKCVNQAKQHLKNGTSVIVDNTNPDIESRSRYVNLAKALKVRCRCFEMNCSYGMARHNVQFRSLTAPSKTEVSTMVLRMFNSKYKKPELSEGFDSIVQVNFVPDFADEKDRQLYGQFLIE